VGTNLYFSGVIDSVMTMFLMSLGEFGDVYAEFDQTDHPLLAKVCYKLSHFPIVTQCLTNIPLVFIHNLHDLGERFACEHAYCDDGSHL